LLALPGYHDTLLAADILAGLPGGDQLLAEIVAGQARVATVGVHSGLIAGSELLPAAEWTAALVHSDGGFVIVDLDGSTIEPVHTVAGPAVRLHITHATATPVGPRSAAANGTSTSGAAVATSRRLRSPAGQDTATSSKLGHPPSAMSGGAARAVAAARIRQAAFLAGIGRAALRAARSHVTRREQFGRKLIEFQTVGHRLATLVAEGDGLELLVHEAAWRLDTGRPVRVHAPQALAATAEYALQATRLAVQLHGARGILADGVPASAYRLAAVEAVRLGTPAALWREAGLCRLTERDQWDDEAAGLDDLPPAATRHPDDLPRSVMTAPARI
jgi:hypothetical protein